MKNNTIIELVFFKKTKRKKILVHFPWNFAIENRKDEELFRLAKIPVVWEEFMIFNATS